MRLTVIFMGYNHDRAIEQSYLEKGECCECGGELYLQEKGYGGFMCEICETFPLCAECVDEDVKIGGEVCECVCCDCAN